MSRASRGRSVCVAVAEGRLQADMWVAMLESAGIPCVGGDQGEIYVPRSLVREARAVLGHSRKRHTRGPSSSRRAGGVRKSDALVGFLLVLLIGVGIALIAVLADAPRWAWG